MQVFVANIGDAKAVLARHPDPGTLPTSPSPSTPASMSAASLLAPHLPSPPLLVQWGGCSGVPISASRGAEGHCSDEGAQGAVPHGASAHRKGWSQNFYSLLFYCLIFLFFFFEMSPVLQLLSVHCTPCAVPSPLRWGPLCLPCFPCTVLSAPQMGGSVLNGRIQGRLEVSRAFGDRLFKKVRGNMGAVVWWGAGERRRGDELGSWALYSTVLYSTGQHSASAVFPLTTQSLAQFLHLPLHAHGPTPSCPWTPPLHAHGPPPFMPMDPPHAHGPPLHAHEQFWYTQEQLCVWCCGSGCRRGFLQSLM